MKVLLASAVLSFLACALLFPLLTRSSALHAMPAQNMSASSTFNCSSDDGRHRYCPADTRGGVQLIKQRSNSPCIFGQTWGYDRRGVWVDRGCRADFIAGYNGGPGGGNPSWPGWGQNYDVYCASDNGRRNHCPIDTRGGVRLVRQRSGSPCVFGQTWGWDRHGVWVDRGCRADFEVGQAGWQPPPAQVITCSSNDMRRNFCPVDTRGGARIIRQRSDADCIYLRTWGYDARGIWVDRGCRADFELGIRR